MYTYFETTCMYSRKERRLPLTNSDANYHIKLVAGIIRLVITSTFKRYAWIRKLSTYKNCTLYFIQMITLSFENVYSFLDQYDSEEKKFYAFFLNLH